MMKWPLVGFLLCLLFIGTQAYGEVYKWVDANGRVHYGDKAPVSEKAEDISDQLSINSYKGAEVSASDFFEAVEATQAEEAKTRRQRVVMYSTTWCGVCKKAKRYFKEKNIPFREYDVETSAKGKQDFARLGGRGVPIILVGDMRMNGFTRTRFERLYQSTQ